MLVLGITKYNNYNYIIIEEESIYLLPLKENSNLNIGFIYDDTYKKSFYDLNQINKLIEKNVVSLIELKFLNQGLYIIKIDSIVSIKDFLITVKSIRKISMKNYDFFIKENMVEVNELNSSVLYGIIKKNENSNDILLLSLIVINNELSSI